MLRDTNEGHTLWIAKYFQLLFVSIIVCFFWGFSVHYIVIKSSIILDHGNAHDVAYSLVVVAWKRS